MDCYQVFSACIRRDTTLLPGDTVGIGVSGGKDSMALLHMSRRYAETAGLHLLAVHVHHGMRGAAADADMTHVKRYCQANGVAFFGVHRDVPALIEQEGLSPEEAARKVRHGVFSDLRSSGRVAEIWLGHNRDDACETFLFHLCRGTGTAGLTGIPAARDGMRRPLLDLSRAQIEAYCREHDIPAVEDASNADTTYARNRIRHEVLPLLETRMNPRTREHLVGVMRDLAQQEALIQDWTDAAANRHLRPVPGGMLLVRAAFADLSPYLLQRLLRRMFAQVTGLKDISRRHIMAVAALTRASGPKEIRMPGRTVAAATAAGLYLGDVRQPLYLPIDFSSPAAVITSGRYRFRLCKNGGKDGKGFIYRFSYDKLKQLSALRRRRAGDRLYFHGKQMKLKDFFIKQRVDPFIRNELYLLALAGTIIWVEGLYADERYFPASGEELVIQLEELEDDGRNNPQVVRSTDDTETDG